MPGDKIVLNATDEIKNNTLIQPAD